jgi:4-hydroxybenzoate polyprenyltransferase
VKRLEKVILAIKMGRPRTWTFAIVSYLFGYMSTNSLVLWQLALGCLVFALGTAATNFINVYTDIEEDSVNLPLRAEMIKRFGRGNLAKLIVVIYPIILVLSAPFGLTFLLVIGLAELDSIGYSLPPLRFKRNPAAGLISFSGAVALSFVGGLVAAGSSILDPLLLLLGSFMFAYGTVKNIPDIKGDVEAGLKTTATLSTSIQRTVRISTLLLLVPYVALLGMIVLNILSPIYLVDFVFLPFLIYWARGNNEASDSAALESLHSFGFVYAVSFILFNMVITYPSTTSLLISILSMSFIAIITKAGIDSRQKPANNLAKSLEKESDKIGFHRY